MMDATILRRLSETIAARRQAAPASSYVASLFGKGHEAILKKVAEESAETLLASKDGDKLHVVRETADLWFHCLVLSWALDEYDVPPSCGAGRASPAWTKRRPVSNAIEPTVSEIQRTLPP